MNRIIVLLTIGFVAFSCKKIPEIPAEFAESILAGNGVFILNEGNFRSGNGSLSYYSYDSAKIHNDIFFRINGWPLGDVPNSMAMDGDRAYIIVNNSGKIEVVKRNTLESVSTIKGLISPRNIGIINDSKAYVTSIYSDSVSIINLKENSISGYINLHRSSEAISISGSKAFISNWMGGKEIMVVNNVSDKVIDSIEVGVEPESMVIDRYNKLWVICNGGWARQNFAELVVINTITDNVEKQFQFPTKQDSPSCLQIDGNGETLYYLEKGVNRMSVNSLVLPVTPFIPESGAYFYKIGINPVNSDIFITDAVDYIQSGNVLYYKNDGTFVSTQKAGIIPGMMCFKLNFNIQTK